MAVQCTITAIKNFANPFGIIEKDHLFILESGAPTSKDVETDILHAEEVGKRKSFCAQNCFKDGDA